MRTVASIHDRVTDIGAYLREQREGARLSVRQLASLAGVSNPYLSQVERGLRNPSAEVLQQIAKGLRISAEALYVRAGILDEELRVGVDRAVHSDPELSDRQKRVLLDIYASFRAENARAAAEDAAASVPRRRPSTRTTSSVPTAASKRAARKAAAAAEERPVRPRRRAKAVAKAAEPSAAPAPASTDPPVTGGAAADATPGSGTTRRATKRSASKRASKCASTRSAVPAPEAAPTDRP